LAVPVKNPQFVRIFWFIACLFCFILLLFNINFKKEVIF